MYHLVCILHHLTLLASPLGICFSITAPLGAMPLPQSLAPVPLTHPAMATTPQPMFLTPAPNAGLILSPASAPFPKKLVDKIRTKQFVDMRELLTDNISLMQQLESIQGPGLTPLIGPQRPRLRQVNSLPTWLYCFLAYITILTNDTQTRDQLSYARLIILEALRHGHLGWLDYDRSFRQQVAANPDIAWNTLIPALHATTILGSSAQPPGRSTLQSCPLCHGMDHTRRECALAYLHLSQPRLQHNQQWNLPNQPPPRPPVCISWNQGRCIFPGKCSYSHICATCPGAASHPACNCLNTPANSVYKRKPTNTRQ